jgi:membrane-associated protein
MTDLLLLLPKLPTIEEIIVWGGYIGLFTIIFSETGLLVGFFLPGDSLLVTAGLFAARGNLDIFLLNGLLWIASIIGNTSGYTIGRKAGLALYNRPQSRFFRRDHLLKTKDFYEKYGGVTIMLACFIPFARTFCPVVAGIGQMQYRKFIGFNIAGSIVWITSMTLLGFFLGRFIPGIEKKIEYVIIAIIFLSLLPIIYKYFRSRSKRKAADATAPSGERGV